LVTSTVCYYYTINTPPPPPAPRNIAASCMAGGALTRSLAPPPSSCFFLLKLLLYICFLLLLANRTYSYTHFNTNIEIHFFSLPRSLCSLPLVCMKPRVPHTHTRTVFLSLQQVCVCVCGRGQVFSPRWPLTTTQHNVSNVPITFVSSTLFTTYNNTHST
jgi:hypothetical protein